MNRHRHEIFIEDEVHETMRKLARRKRVNIGFLYDEAAKLFLASPEAYMGKNVNPFQRGKPKQQITPLVKRKRKEKNEENRQQA